MDIDESKKRLRVHGIPRVHPALLSSKFVRIVSDRAILKCMSSPKRGPVFKYFLNQVSNCGLLFIGGATGQNLSLCKRL